MDWLQQQMDRLSGAPGWVLVGIACLIVGLTLKRIRSFPNSAIPCVVLLVGMLGNSLLAAEEPKGITHRAWLVRQIIIGLVIGFSAWGFHRIVLKKLAERFPILKPALSEWDSAPPIVVPGVTPEPLGQKPEQKETRP